MINKKIIVISVPLLVIAVCIIFYVKYQPSRGEFPNCVRMRYGTASIDVSYPNQFVTFYTSMGLIYIKSKESPANNTTTNPYILVIQDYWLSPMSVDDLITGQLADNPNINYQKTILNGYDVARAEVDVSGAIEYWYFIPVGNRVIRMFYSPSAIPNNEQQLGQKLLDSIILKEVSDDYSGVRVENCKDNAVRGYRLFNN